MAEKVRTGLLMRTCLEVLQDAGDPLAPAEVVSRVGVSIGNFTPHELEALSGGRVRWENVLNAVRVLREDGTAPPE